MPQRPPTRLHRGSSDWFGGEKRGRGREGALAAGIDGRSVAASAELRRAFESACAVSWSKSTSIAYIQVVLRNLELANPVRLRDDDAEKALNLVCGRSGVNSGVRARTAYDARKTMWQCRRETPGTSVIKRTTW